MNKKRIAFGIGITLAVLAVFAVSSAAALPIPPGKDAIIFFDPDPSSGPYGEDVTVQIKVNTSVDLDGWCSFIYYDSDCYDIPDGDYTGTYFPHTTRFDHFATHVVVKGGNDSCMTVHNEPVLLVTLTLKCVKPSGACTAQIYHHPDHTELINCDLEYVDYPVWVHGNFSCEAPTYTINGTTTPAADTVNITNLNNSKEWAADVNDTGFYNLMLNVGEDVNATEILRIIACDTPDNYTSNCNRTDHKVVDISGETVNLLLNHYCQNYYPTFPFHTWNESNWSGPAAMEMLIDHYLDPPDVPNQTVLNKTAIEDHNQDCNKDIQFVDPRGVRYTLNDYLYYPYSPYVAHYGIGSYADVNDTLHYMCKWHYLGPGTAPAYGDYSNWMVVRGIHTNKTPSFTQGSYEIYGFWINDPNPTGIGEDTYKSVEQWKDTYHKMLNVNSADIYNGTYIAVCEPPEDDDVEVTLAKAKPRLAKAVIPMLMQKTFLIDDVEEIAFEMVTRDEDSLRIVKAAIEGVTEELLPYDPAFAAVFENTVAGVPKLVTDDDGNEYYLVPFEVPVDESLIELKKPVKLQKIEEDMIELLSMDDDDEDDDEVEIKPLRITCIAEERTLVVVLVDAEDGSFMEASWVEEPVKYLPVSKREALKLVLKEIRDNKLKAFGMPAIELVHRDSSPYAPDWKITIGKMVVFYVSQDGKVSYELLCDAGDTWEQFHYDAANTGYTTSEAPDIPNLLWDSGDIAAVPSSQPVIADDKVFVWADDKVYALEKSCGGEIWNTTIPSDTLGYNSWATPAYSNGALFVSAGYNLTKFDAATGAILEQIAFPDGGYSCNGGPTVVNGVVFAGSGYDITFTGTPTHYYAFNESDLNDTMWSFDVGAYNAASSTPAVADGKVFVGSGTKIYCLDATTGLEVWNYTTDASGWPFMGGSVTYADGYVYGAFYIFDIAGAYGPVYKLDASTGNNESGWPVWVKATDSTPAVVDDKVYICGGCSPYLDPWSGTLYTYNGTGVYCFDTDGTLIWQNESNETELIMGSWTCSPALADGMVFVGDPSNAYSDMFEFNGTYALDAATGDELGYMPYGGASPAVADGLVFTVARGHVYAFGKLKSYGVSVYHKKNIRFAWRALGEPDRRGAIMFRDAKIAIELEETIPECTKVSVWARRVAVRRPRFDVGVSSDGEHWTKIGSATCKSPRWKRFDFTGNWDDVKYIGIRKPGGPWRPKLMGLDAVYAEGGC